MSRLWWLWAPAAGALIQACNRTASVCPSCFAVPLFKPCGRRPWELNLRPKSGPFPKKHHTGWYPPSLVIVCNTSSCHIIKSSHCLCPRAALSAAGVLVRSVNPTSAAAAVLRPDDVLLAFDGTEIASDGTVAFRTGERIAFSHLISNKV